MEDGAAVLDVEANNEGRTRTATIAVTAKKDGGEALIRNAYISQEAVENDLTVLVPEVNLASVGKAVKIHASGNSTVEAFSSSAWCVTKASGNEVEISADINISGENREAYVTVVAGAGNGGKALAKSIRVIQKAVDLKFEFTDPTAGLGYKNGTEYIQLISTGEWVLNNKADEISNWLAVTPDNGTGDALITLTYKTNPFKQSRKTQLSFTNTFMNKPIALTIMQEARQRYTGSSSAQ